MKNLVMMHLEDLIKGKLNNALKHHGKFEFKGRTGSSVSFKFTDKSGHVHNYIVKLQEK